MGDFFVRRPIVAMVISIIMVLLGLVAMASLPIAQYPEIVPPMVQVTTTFVGASATDVEASVATPLEQKMNGVENMIYMKSTNANDGTLTLKVTFDVGTDLDTANVLTQNRVSEAMPSLPQAVKNYGIDGDIELSIDGRDLELLSCIFKPGFQAPDDSFAYVFYGLFRAISLGETTWQIGAFSDIPSFLVPLNSNMKFHISPNQRYLHIKLPSDLFGDGRAGKQATVSLWARDRAGRYHKVLSGKLRITFAGHA